MEKLRLILLWVFVVLFSVAGVGCGRGIPNPPDYRTSPFRVELCGVRGEEKVSAEGSYSPSKVPDLPWDFTLRLTSPKSLEGIILRRQDGTVSLSFEGMETDADSLDGLLSLLSLPATTGEIKGLSLDRTMGEPLLYAQIEKEGEVSPLELWLDPESGFPKQIKKGELSLDILFFEPISSDT